MYPCVHVTGIVAITSLSFERFRIAEAVNHRTLLKKVLSDCVSNYPSIKFAQRRDLHGFSASPLLRIPSAAAQFALPLRAIPHSLPCGTDIFRSQLQLRPETELAAGCSREEGPPSRGVVRRDCYEASGMQASRHTSIR